MNLYIGIDVASEKHNCCMLDDQKWGWLIKTYFAILCLNSTIISSSSTALRRSPLYNKEDRKKERNMV